MSNLNKFLGIPKTVNINGKEIILQPLKVKDLAKFGKINMTDEEKQNVGKNILLLSIEGSTEEEIEALPIEIFTKLMDEVNKLNGFTDDKLEKIKSIKQRINQ